MRVIIIAAMTPSGVIGRTSKACTVTGCNGGEYLCEERGATSCDTCDGTGRVPCNDLPWGRAYPEIEARVALLTSDANLIMEADYWRPKYDHERTYVIRRGGSLVEAMRDFGITQGTICRGSARLFAEALQLADELDLTLIGREYEGDVRFPGGQFPWESSAKIYEDLMILSHPYWYDFRCVSLETCPTNADLTFTKWERRR